MANNPTLNNDPRLLGVTADKAKATNTLNVTYDNMINASDDYYKAQIDASEQWADKQGQLQQEQTDFTIEKIEQQKDQAHKDYLREQTGAYVDWQKQSDQYGVEAEKIAAAGMDGTGYSESSQVKMYTAYQSRVATAREAYSRAVLNYDNAIKDAQLQNNSALAEIAFKSLQQQLELSLQGFQYKNELILDKANKKMELDNIFNNRYLETLNLINQEKAQAEQVRQFNLQYELDVKTLEEDIRRYDEEIARLKENDAKEYALQIQELKLEKEALQLQRDELDEEKRQFDAKLAADGETADEGGEMYIANFPISVEEALPLVASGFLNATQDGNAITLSLNPKYLGEKIHSLFAPKK